MEFNVLGALNGSETHFANMGHRITRLLTPGREAFKDNVRVVLNFRDQRPFVIIKAPLVNLPF